MPLGQVFRVLNSTPTDGKKANVKPMDMLIGFLMGLLTVGFALVGILTWQVRKALKTLAETQKEALQRQKPEQVESLTQKVGEIQQAMGGVMNGIKAVGHQVHHLNQMAGQAASHVGEPVQRIMIEIRRRGGSRPDMGEDPDWEDMPEEMQDRLRAFQSLYWTILSRKKLPSQDCPEDN